MNLSNSFIGKIIDKLYIPLKLYLQFEQVSHLLLWIFSKCKLKNIIIIIIIITDKMLHKISRLCLASTTENNLNKELKIIHNINLENKHVHL